MIKRRVGAISAVLVALAASFALMPGTASASSAAAPCAVTPKSGVGTVNVRNEASTSSAVVNWLQQGEYMTSNCTGTTGGRYTACGATSNLWVYVIYGPGWFETGYVARACVNIHEDV